MLDKTRRMFKIDMQKLRTADSSHLFWMDLLMLIIVAINLMYLFFGFLFQFGFFSSSIHYISSDFYNWYNTQLYPHVLDYDLILGGFVVFTAKNMIAGGFIRLCIGTMLLCAFRS